MKIVAVILGFLIFNKLFLFWLWLWQLKEYHWGRFRAHFETQAVKKAVSSLWRPKVPKFTIKTLAIIFYTLLFEFVIFVRLSYLSILLLIILAPVITALMVLLFQGVTIAWQNKILKKAKEKREKFKDLIVIGITGSYGKTSTKEFLATILSEKFKVLKTRKNINSEVGIAQTILKELTPEHEIFIAEVGAYNKGKIREVCAMLQPKIGILTGINEQHMSTFGTQENIVKAKYELIEALPENGLAIFNGNNKYCQKLYEKTFVVKKLVQAPSDKFMAENVAMAQAAAEALDVTSFAQIKTHLPVQKGINGLNIIDSTYSANPDGVIAHLEYIKTLPGKKVIVMPCLIELGKAAKQVHQRIGERIAQICDLGIIMTQDYFEDLKQGENIIFLKNPKQILEKIKNFSQPGDIILLEGRDAKKLWELKK